VDIADVLTPPELDGVVVPDGFEMLDGMLVEKRMGEKSCWIGGQLFGLIWTFLQTNPLGRVYPQDTGFRCFPNRPRHIRKPDVAFVRAEHLGPDLADGEPRVRPDLAAEVISPHETVEELDEKISDYQSVGVPLIWVVNPATRTVRVIRQDGSSPPFLTDADALTGEDVLPGFSCRVADFLPPAPAGAR
jgi:Uma2 family endonuclease